MRILVTGSAGFIGGYLVNELLDAGYHVVGIDNYSKCGITPKPHDRHPRYKLIVGDCKDPDLMREAIKGCDQVIAGAAMIGGIAYFHRLAYDLMAENERILASTFDAAIAAHKAGTLKRINVISSSMVFENATVYPTPEGHEKEAPPPLSTYGFQKLASEYFAIGAQQQYGLPYTIIRPFNCVGAFEGRVSDGEDTDDGSLRLGMNHVLPEMAEKVLKGQDPLEILGEGGQVRCYTHGIDIARGIRTCLESEAAVNQDFNISTDRPTTVLELAKLVWREVHGDRSFRYVCHPPFVHDVQKRVPDTTKSVRVLGFRAEVPLEQSVREVVRWVEDEIRSGRI